MKGKGEKERYTHLSAEFQRITRRDKKAFLSEQCKEIVESTRMEKILCNDGHINDRNGKDLTEAERLRRGGKNTQKSCTIKGSNDPDNHSGVVTNLEPGILGCKVIWALGSITTNKANGGDGILAELFQILKDDAVKVLH